MEMPSPTQQHKALERLVGEWVGAEAIHPNPMTPEGGSAVGRVSDRAALSGFAVVQDYEQERDGEIWAPFLEGEYERKP